MIVSCHHLLSWCIHVYARFVSLIPRFLALPSLNPSTFHSTAAFPFILPSSLTPIHNVPPSELRNAEPYFWICWKKHLHTCRNWYVCNWWHFLFSVLWGEGQSRLILQSHIAAIPCLGLHRSIAPFFYALSSFNLHSTGFWAKVYIDI